MRKFNVTVNGKAYEVEVEEVGGAPIAAAVAAPIAAPKAAAPTGGTVVASPLPGLVLKLNVANGTAVKKGQKLVVLEAMKMENDIVASADGIVTFLVKQGDTVEVGGALASIK